MPEAVGNSKIGPSNLPGTVSGIANAVAVAAGCALLSSGTVQCWGGNAYGQLGNGTTTDSSVPVTVSGITNAIAVAAGGSPRTCALLSNGSIQCWGCNTDGQLGNGTTADSSVPVTVSGITNAIAVAAGDSDHTCAVLSNGSIQCWGCNTKRLSQLCAKTFHTIVYARAACPISFGF